MTSPFNNKNTCSVKISRAVLRDSIIAVMIALIVASPIVYAGSSFAFHTQYNLPLPSPLEHQPSYAIRIPFGAAETDTGYEPANVSIPAGMTVGWFNDDSVEHTVTALTNESEQGGSSPDPLAPILEPVLENVKLGVEQFDSGVIPPGGFSIYTFTKPGTYPYYDELNPSHRGQINVGDLMERGKNMDMRIGGDLPFNASELGRVVLTFIPKTISLPSPLELTYNVTISNSTVPVYTHEFGDIDGILDLEIMPVNKLNPSMQVGPGTNASNNNTTTSGSFANNTNTTAGSATSGSTIETTTYGPDLNSPITGTYHIEGPILVEPTPYFIKVVVTKIDLTAPSQPIVDEFTLPASVGG